MVLPPISITADCHLHVKAAFAEAPWATGWGDSDLGAQKCPFSLKYGLKARAKRDFAK